MRHDVLRSIRESRDVTSAIILTHNIDFAFIQALVLPALRKCGSPAVTVFADATCSKQSFELQHRILSGLGSRYRVVAVPMLTGFRFHPKAVLLSGPEQATLLIGSGNLTFGGWRENAEVWTRYDTGADGTSTLAAFRDYLQQVLALCADPKDSIIREVAEAFDGDSRTWALHMEPPSGLLVRAGRGPSLLEQMRATLGDRRADHVYVCVPYFDEGAQALNAAATLLSGGSCPATVLVQSGRTTLMQTAANGLGANISLRDTKFEHRERIGSKGQERVRQAFIHGKWYAVECGSEAFIFAGSADCSQAALTIPGRAGNAELLTWSILPVAVFRQTFLNELVITDSSPTLAAQADVAPATTANAPIGILAARLEAGRLEIAYRGEQQATITGALVDEALLSPNGQTAHTVSFQRNHPQPRTVLLIGIVDGKEVRSAIHWVDNETALRVSARSRSLADSIDTLVRKGTWSIGAWTEVLGELYRHLEYMPSRTFVGHGSAHIGEDRHGPAEFTWSDVFANDYRFTAGLHLPHLALSGDQRIGGLRSMLLRWFGIAQPELSEPEFQEDLTPEPNPTGFDPEGDRPVPLPKSNGLDETTNPQRKRAKRLVAQVADRFADRDFLSNRPPELLAADLKVAALLLRAGLADKWLSEDDFLGASVRIWLPLFFNAEGDDTTGWIEQRYLTAPDREQFADSLGSAELAAALACWALSIPANRNTPEHTRFVLASVLSVARLPWMWQTGGNQAIAKQVADVFGYTSNQFVNWGDIERNWVTMVRRGYALQRLQAAILGRNIVEISKRITQTAVDAGELLWQGKYGFCVAGSRCDRAPGNNCDVLLLQRKDACTRFTGPLLIPVQGLLEDHVIPEATLSRRARAEIAAMVRELSSGFRRLAPAAG